MKRDHQVVILLTLIIILVAGLMIYVLSAKTNELAAQIKANRNHKYTDELITSIENEDYVIYMLGSTPEELNAIGDHLIPIGFEPLTEDNMPVYWINEDYDIHDDLGNVIGHHSPRTYSKNMLIVVNIDYSLNDEYIEILRNCSVKNHVPLMFIGNNQAALFREALILVPTDYGENGTMYFENGLTSEGPVLAEEGDVILSRDLTDAIMNYMIHLIGPEVQESENIGDIEDGN